MVLKTHFFRREKPALSTKGGHGPPEEPMVSVFALPIFNGNWTRDNLCVVLGRESFGAVYRGVRCRKKGLI